MPPEQILMETTKQLNQLLSQITEMVRRENKKYLTIIFVLVIASTIISIGCTTLIVSGCFLSKHKVPGVCSVIPGYEETADNNDVLLKQFYEMNKRSKENQKRIDELEKQLNDER